MDSRSFRVVSSLGYALILLIQILTFTSCGRQESPKSQEKKAETQTTPVQQPQVALPEYSILNEDINDTPLKTQITLNILVSGEISKTNLTNLLNELYSKTQDRTGFKYHNRPTHIGIYAYTSKEYAQAGLGQWIAMLLKIGENVKPEITINERQISQLGAKPEAKFGLSEDKRRQIWDELIKAERRADSETEQRYPLPDPLEPNYSASYAGKQVEKQGKLRSFLREKYESEIAKKYGLTSKQLNKIVEEAIAKDWPFPAEE